MEVGAVTETINVSGAVVQVNTSNSTLTEVIDNARIMDLVLNGRDVAKLAAVVAGMSVISVSAETGKSLPGGLQLASWVALDSQNQRTTVRLSGHRYGLAVADSAFRYNDPRTQGPR